VTAVDAAGRVVRVLGQDVRIDAGTTFDAATGGLPGVHVGDVLAIFALPDASGDGRVATRIEPAPAGAALRLRGTVGALDTSARTLRIGGLTLSYDGASGVPSDLAVGSRVRIVVRAPQGGGGPFAVASFGRQEDPPHEGERAQVEGVVSSFAGVDSFVVGGVRIDAQLAELRPTGAVLANGVRIQAQGEVVSGELVAEKVVVLANSDVQARVYKLNGRIESANLVNRTFVLKKTVVDWTNAQFIGGSSSGLSAGVRVRVEGPMSSDGVRLLATKVEFRE
jgi:hypothetical protein